MPSRSKGFTLIELMIVIAIVGVLTTMALPSFMDQAIRGQTGEAFRMVEGVKKEIETHYLKTGRLPEDNGELGLPEASRFVGNYVSGVEIHRGAISITLGNKVNKFAEGKLISIRPALVRNEPKVPIAWVCGYASAPGGMEVIGENQTTILKRHLPVECRY